MAYVHDDRVWNTLVQQTTVPPHTDAGAAKGVQPLAGNKLQPNKPKSEKAAKYGPRDSLKSRNSFGRPGSKRYQRWLNDFFLLELNKSLSDIEDEFEWMDDTQFFFDTTPRPPLRKLFDDPASLQLFEPFINVTETNQSKLMAILNKLHEAKTVEDTLSSTDASDEEEDIENVAPAKPKDLAPEQSLKKLTKDSRKLLKRYADSEILADLNRQVLAFVTNTEGLSSQHFKWSDGFQRKLGHAVCQFYCLHSFSRDTTDGRATVASFTDVKLSPHVSLLQFLATA